ncbi:hypothetical protein ACA910_018051 [Epithemia clementina (nom. ined.)]
MTSGGRHNQGAATEANEKDHLGGLDLVCNGSHHVEHYQATQSAQCIKFLALGNRHNPNNVFRWDRIVLNLPGNSAYCPSIAWVRRMRCCGQLAANVHPYVDDLRETAPSEHEAWRAASVMAKAASFYGLQDAARKRREPSVTPGALAGVLIEAVPHGVYKLVADERWEKVCSHIATLTKWSTLDQTTGRLSSEYGAS